MNRKEGDRELLELAARASNIDLSGYEWDEQEATTDWCKSIGIEFFWGFVKKNYGSSRTWNPLTSDHDAFRLAVKLGMVVFAGGKNVEVYSGRNIFISVYNEHDEYYATRRAIVKCAAAIARKEQK